MYKKAYYQGENEDVASWYNRKKYILYITAMSYQSYIAGIR